MTAPTTLEGVTSDGATAAAEARRQRRPRRLSLTGAVLGLTFGAMSVTPSLVPRVWFLQALVTGLCVVTGYGLGAFVGWAYRALGLPNLPDRARSVAWKVLGRRGRGRAARGRLARLAVAVRPARAARHGLLGAAGLAGSRRCSALRRRRPAARHRPGGQGPRPSRVPTARTGPAGAGGLADRDRRHRRGDLPRVLRPPHRQRHLALQTRSSRATTRTTSPGWSTRRSRPVRAARRRGSRWDSIGREGRAFVASGPTAGEIAAVVGDPAAVEPVRAFVGLETAPTPAERAQIAVDELRRLGGFQRGAIAVAGTTGSGWIDPMAADALEYATHGDVATVSTQYSYLPSWLSFLVDRSRAATNAEQLLTALRVELDGVAGRPATGAVRLRREPGCLLHRQRLHQRRGHVDDDRRRPAHRPAELRRHLAEGRRRAVWRGHRPGSRSTATGPWCGSPPPRPSSPTRP